MRKILFNFVFFSAALILMERAFARAPVIHKNKSPEAQISTEEMQKSSQRALDAIQKLEAVLKDPQKSQKFIQRNNVELKEIVEQIEQIEKDFSK